MGLAVTRGQRIVDQGRCSAGRHDVMALVLSQSPAMEDFNEDDLMAISGSLAYQVRRGDQKSMTRYGGVSA